MAMIEEYEFGRIVINGRVYTSDVVVHSGGVEEGWWRKEGHRVSLEDIEIIDRVNPEVVIFGKGAYGKVRVDQEVRTYFESKNVEVFEEDSYTAVRIFESFLKKGKKAVLAIHLTC